MLGSVRRPFTMPGEKYSSVSSLPTPPLIIVITALCTVTIVNFLHQYGVLPVFLGLEQLRSKQGRYRHSLELLRGSIASDNSCQLLLEKPGILGHPSTAHKS